MKIFSIVGSTAIGKTSFALELATQVLEKTAYDGVDLVSADSRQVYQGLEIISGADIPPRFKENKISQLTYSFLTKNKINLHGVSIISPDSEWSVAHFQDLAWEVMRWAEQKNRLVIIIGGTGLYHDQLLNLDASLRVKPNKDVRRKAEQMKLTDLQNWTRKVNEIRFSTMNNSDVNNPRRLIRAIEIGLSSSKLQKKSPTLDFEQIYVGLNQNLIKIEQKIKARVRERFVGAAIDEVKKLRQQYADYSLPAFSALGVSQISQYLNGSLSKEECLQQWVLHELQYARRQLTWWKNQDVVWFKIDKPEWKQQAFTYILNLC